MKCKICNSSDLEIYYPAKGKKGKLSFSEALCTGKTSQIGNYSTIWKCRSCAVIFQEPSFSEKELQDAYEKSQDKLYLEQVKERENIFKNPSSKKYTDPF